MPCGVSTVAGAERVVAGGRVFTPACGVVLVTTVAVGAAGKATGARSGVGCVTLCAETTGVVGVAAVEFSLYCVPIFMVAPDPV
jgi:hypothetical protein